MSERRYPSLFQLNTRVRLTELGAALKRPATLDDLPDAELDGLAEAGFDIVWLLGVWQTGEAARRIAASEPGLVEEYHRTLPDFSEEDVCGSCFAVQDYRVHREFGGDEALARLRRRLADRGLRLVLDFVPNHVAPDHAWVKEAPEFFVEGTRERLAAEPRNWTRVEAPGGPRVLAYGRDPYFAGWSDTLQLNYGSPALQEAMLGVLKQVARRCDGVRCDMAMLVLPEVFEKTWGIPAAPFWPRATAAVREEAPGFLFLAEVYWDLEWALQRQGFDFTYDKRLYDRLRAGEARPVREHLLAGLEYQDRLARFLENHDEPRAAATFAPEVHRAAALITFLAPGLRFFHGGQREGKRVRIPVQVRRGPTEPVDALTESFYDALWLCLRDPAFGDGHWRLLECRPAWEGNGSWDSFVAFSWSGPDDRRRLVAVNFSGHRSQCWVTLPWSDLDGQDWRLADRMGTDVYVRGGSDLASSGLYLDLPPWGTHLFDLEGETAAVRSCLGSPCADPFSSPRFSSLPSPPFAPQPRRRWAHRRRAAPSGRATSSK